MQTITIMTEPRGKGRPRFAHGHAYTPKTTRDYENLIRMAYKRQGGVLHEGAICIMLEFLRGVPKSWTRKQREQAMSGELDSTSKPDIDNLCKAALDALNGVAWADDKQVVCLIATKGFADEPCIRLTIGERGDFDGVYVRS